MFGFSTDILKPRRGHLQPVFEPEYMKGSSNDEHCEFSTHEAHRTGAGQTNTTAGKKAGQRSTVAKRNLGHNGTVVAISKMGRGLGLRLATDTDYVLLEYARCTRRDDVCFAL